jgi:type VI secretion system secreted protein Hcp
MAADIFAKIGDIKGESSDAKHKDEIEVLSWSWGVSTTAGPGPGGGGGVGAGKATFQDISLTHTLDRASPALMQACATGQHFKDGLITVRKAGKEQHEYLVIKMNDLIVSSVGDSSSGDRPMESITLSYAKIHIEYKEQKPDGSLGASSHFKYDVKTGKTF